MFRFENFQAVLRDPVMLGEFLTEASKIAEMEKVARERAISIMLRGFKVPGWLLRRKENSYVLPSALEPLMTESLDVVLHAFGSISERRYRELCARCGVVPAPLAIVRAGTTVTLSKANIR